MKHILVIFPHPCIEAYPASFLGIEPRDALSYIGSNMVYGNYHGPGMQEHIFAAREMHDNPTLF
ncbi:MAG: hypothetical protein ACYDHX_13960 [Methanothrix sp.]